jgi:hypothetical protein
MAYCYLKVTKKTLNLMGNFLVLTNLEKMKAIQNLLKVRYFS